ncbi:hypothetical protein DICVIV_11954 [Dictyocaulus viviparus]|uniref:glucuronosyltransferase n=1 Tax=Dictyocaulus viviparus TaxID=29172 RepID=A0A0D8XEH7_DICVI|nr:hypothetical protein DICVIV_11954 [Dictyocaulus viviparus]
MKLLFVLSCALFAIIDAFKILVYSSPMGYSHMQFMGRIADILVEAGHDVTVLHPIWEPKHLKAVSESAKQILIDLPMTLKAEFQPVQMNLWDRNSLSISQQLRMFANHTKRQLSACEVVLKDEKIMSRLLNERFDAGITEILGDCGFGIFEATPIFRLWLEKIESNQSKEGFREDHTMMTSQ